MSGKTAAACGALFALSTLLTSCGYPAYGSSMRSNFDPETPIEAICFRDKEKVAQGFQYRVAYMAQYGWRLSYIGEYTSTGRTKYIINYCFERPKGSPMPPGYAQPPSVD